MKLMSGLLLSEVAGEYIVVPTGDSAKAFKGVIRLNESAKTVFECLQKGMDIPGIVRVILDEYEGVDEERARRSAQAVISQLQEAGLLEE